MDWSVPIQTNPSLSRNKQKIVLPRNPRDCVRSKMDSVVPPFGARLAVLIIEGGGRDVVLNCKGFDVTLSRSRAADGKLLKSTCTTSGCLGNGLNVAVS